MTRWATILVAGAFFLADAVGAEEVTVKLSSGDKLIGELISDSDWETVIEHPLFGRMAIPKEAIDHTDGEPPGLFNTSVLRGWSKEFGVGLSGQEGNSPEANVRMNLRLFRETEDWRWRITGTYRIATERQERTSNYGKLDTRYDWLIPGSRWFSAVGGGYQYDEFEPWQHRVNAFAGPGYHFVEGETFSLDGLTGPSYTYEFEGDNGSRPEWLFGVELKWRPFDGHRVTFRNVLLQQLDENEQRNLTRAEWKMRVMGTEHLSFILGFDNEYDTAAEDDKNNLKYWSSIAYDF